MDAPILADRAYQSVCLFCRSACRVLATPSQPEQR